MTVGALWVLQLVHFFLICMSIVPFLANVANYCKRGYFHGGGGGFRENVGKTFHVGVIFTIVSK